MCQYLELEVTINATALKSWYPMIVVVVIMNRMFLGRWGWRANLRAVGNPTMNTWDMMVTVVHIDMVLPGWDRRVNLRAMIDTIINSWYMVVFFNGESGLSGWFAPILLDCDATLFFKILVFWLDIHLRCSSLTFLRKCLWWTSLALRN